MKRIKIVLIAMLLIALVGTICANELVRFGYQVTYHKAQVEVEVAEPTTLMLELVTIPDQASLRLYRSDEPTTSAVVTFTKLYPGTVYGVNIGTNETVYNCAATGYLLQTWDRWRFAQEKLKNKGDIDTFIEAIDELAPNQSGKVLDKIEEKARREHFEAIKAKRVEQKKALDMVQE